MRPSILGALCLAVTSACGGASTAPAEEPPAATASPPAETAPSAAPATAPSPIAALERLLAAVEAGDTAAIVAAFHPRLRDEVAGELANEPQDLARPEIRACLRAFVDGGALEPLDAEAAARAASFGEEPTQVVVPGGDDAAVLVRHEGGWVLLDTGC